MEKAEKVKNSIDMFCHMLYDCSKVRTGCTGSSPWGGRGGGGQAGDGSVAVSKFFVSSVVITTLCTLALR